jgi:hypothetical protein
MSPPAAQAARACRRPAIAARPGWLDRAMGCSIGQGPSGVGTLAQGSFVALGSL